MLRTVFTCLVLVFLVSVANTPAFAERRVALVIGNSDYALVNTLPNPVRDATKVAEALERLSFDVTLHTNQSFRDMRRSLRDFARQAARADMAVVYFAGHGIEIDRQNYLIPVDAELREDVDIEFETLSLDHIMRSVRGARNLRMVLLDACRNNPFAQSMQMTRNTRSVGRGLARVEPDVGTLVSYAAKQGTVALDGDGLHSPYTKALLKYLEEPGLEVNFLFRKVRDAVLQETNRRQEPFTYGSLPGKQIYLRKPEDKPSLAEQNRQKTEVELAYWNAIKDSNDPAVIQSYLDKYPEGQFAFLAQVMLRKAQQEEVDRVTEEARQAAEIARQKAEAEAQRKAAKEAERKAAEAAKQDAKRRARLKEALAAAQAAERRAEELARARREADERAKALADERAKQEAERSAQLEAALAAARQAERRAKALASERAEAAARREAEEKARLEAERLAEEEASRRAALEAALAAAREAERQAKLEAKERAEAAAKRAEDRKARIEAERKARLEAEDLAEQAAKREAERKDKLETALAAAKAAEEKARELANLQAEAVKRREVAKQREADERERRANELKAWQAVQFSKDAKRLTAFLKAYPKGIFTDLAQARLAAVKQLKLASLQPQAGSVQSATKEETDPQKPALSKRELTLEIQRHLQRLSCNPGRPDGAWGRQSRAALKRFVRTGKLRLASLEPSQDVLDAVSRRTAKSCPFVCGRNQVLSPAGRCVAKTKLRRDEKKKLRRDEKKKKQARLPKKAKPAQQRPQQTKKKARGSARSRCPSWCYYYTRGQVCLDRKSGRWCRNKQNQLID